VSAAFRFLLQAREKLYSARILPTLQLQHPVVSVGNLTVGGNGKTPLVIALAAAFRERGLRPVVLSRGYGRTSREICVVAASTRRVRWEDTGDEPYMISRRLENVPVVVGADRYKAGLLAERGNLGNIFILDDGFQHRRLHRDFDIVAIDPAEWSSAEALLPAGRWREPKSALLRAHAACIQENNAVPAPDLPIPAFTVRTEIDGLFQDDRAVPVASVRGRAVVAFAGIAKPERFFNALRDLGVQPLRCIPFRDHHHYSRREIEKLGGEVLITTEKDAVRLRDFGEFVHVRISAKIPELDRLMSLILERIAARLPV
jgi:tetraacyldisaccharide 4'-kinase